MPTAPVRTHGRIPFLDEARGLAVWCMLIYHLLFTMDTFFGYSAARQLYFFFRPAEPWFAGLFVFISGISCRLSSNNKKRGLQLLAVAMAMTAVTSLLERLGVEDSLVLFGILHLLAVSILFFALLRPWLDRISPVVGLVITGLLTAVTVPVERGWLGVGALSWSLPNRLYQSNLLMPLGMYGDTFYSADYFPLLPWLFVFLAGSFAGRGIAAGRYPAFFDTPRCPPLSWAGRHALILYLVHQPLYFGILWLLKWMVDG